MVGNFLGRSIEIVKSRYNIGDLYFSRLVRMSRDGVGGEFIFFFFSERERVFKCVFGLVFFF